MIRVPQVKIIPSKVIAKTHSEKFAFLPLNKVNRLPTKILACLRKRISKNRLQKPFARYISDKGVGGSTANKTNRIQKRKTRQRTSSNCNPAKPAAAGLTAVPPQLSQHNKQQQHSQWRLDVVAAAAATPNSSSTAAVSSKHS